MKKIVLSGIVLLSLLSCTREKLKTTVTLKLPEYQGVVSKDVQIQSTNQFNSSLNPSTVSDINCYGIFVGGPETFMQANNCYDATTNVVKMKFGPSRFFIPAGAETSIEVPSGPARQIFLVGLKAQGTACSQMGPTQSPDFSNLSVPYILSERTLDLQPGDVFVDMTRTIDSTKTFDSCSFISGGGGTSANLFGNGRDGNLNVTGPAYLNFGSDNYSADPDVAQAAAVNSPITTTKKVSTSKRVVNIDNGTGTILTLDSSVTNFDFEAGDEILWYVSSAWGSPSPDDHGCGTGSSLYRGRFGFANVVSVQSALNLVLDKPLTSTPGSINNTNLAQASTTPGTPFCRIHVSRVPNFDTITIAASQSLNFTVTNFSSLAGGIIAFRANEIILNSGATLSVNADGKGFGSATSAQGNSVEGVGSVSLPTGNANGGGSGSSSGGGGAGSADGSDSGGTTPGLRGTAVKYCIGATPCLPARDQKMFFGGGGGGAGAGAGGIGGGIVFIHAKKISGSGALTLSSKGTMGSSGTGGGGGGSVSLTVKEIPSTITTSISADGGNGMSGTFMGGGGGGGVTEVKYCGTLSNISNITATANGGSGFTNASNAPSNAQEMLAVPSLCNY